MEYSNATIFDKPGAIKVDPGRVISQFLEESSGIIHVGANTGQEAKSYANRNLPVVWLEPLPAVFEKLKANIAPYPRQSAIQALITDQDGQEYEFGIANNGAQSSSIYPLARHREIWPSVEYVGSIPLKSVTLKTLIETEGIDLGTFDALILDVQATELLVLKGLGEYLGRFKWIRCEAADFEMYAGGCRLTDLDDYLIPRGFARVKTWQGIGKQEVGFTYEALYRRNDVVVTDIQSIKLNLGGGYQKIPGYLNLDRKLGSEVYPLEYEDGTVDEIRASHVLEHFPHSEVPLVLAEWVRVLKPGGLLKLAVPDLGWIAARVGREDLPIESYLMGGQADENDFHKSIFTEARLKMQMTQTGLTDLTHWKSDIEDCASLPVSLNLQGRKPDSAAVERGIQVTAKVVAIGSVPRLGWQAHFGALWAALNTDEYSIPFWKFGGAFWEQGLTKGLEKAFEEKVDYVIAVDYDTVCTAADVKELITLAAMYDEADAIIPWQVRRGGDGRYLFTIADAAGNARREAPAEEFDKDLTPITTGHFGLTLIKTRILRKMPHPWLMSVPNPENGRWDEKRMDADIYFWKQLHEAGGKAFIANNVRVGHIEEEITWVDRDFEVFRQTFNDFNTNGKPKSCL